MLTFTRFALGFLGAVLSLNAAQGSTAEGTINIQLGGKRLPAKAHIFYIKTQGRAVDIGASPAYQAPIESRGSQPTVSGSRAMLRDGVAYAPASAPANVKAAIWAVNNLRRMPYRMGGGHGSFEDSAYDCSGTVSFALHSAGLLSTPMSSGDLTSYGEGGRGKWVTVYSRNGHAFAMIAGLRLDTTEFGYGGGNVGPRWHDEGRDLSGFEARHTLGL